MADIRIKDLTTEVSSTATGDFFVIDGTTGTRKTPAFNPTFGGNATVTGTLTVNGASTLTGATTIGGDSSNGNYLSYNSDISGFCGLWMRQSSKSATNYVLASNGTSGTLVNATGASLFLRIENTTALEINTSRNVLIPTTTASTTTSTGALVVGNGTSGGLGVGGNIYAGGNVVSTAAGGKFLIFGTGNTTESKELTFKRSDDADNFTLGLTGSAYAGSLTGLGNNEAFLYNSNASAFRIFIGTLATNRFDFTQSQFKINATTASTTTSSGALVVSGGVGVAKSVTVGENIDIGTGHGTKLYVNNSGAWSNKELLVTGYADLTDFTQIKVPGNASNTASLKLDQTGLVTISGAVRTAAPSGGTAANWKLGTVATVSPTSPNRTIEVDIGGTIYYLAAKTTNN